MKLTKWTQIILVGVCAVSLAACSSHKKSDQSAVDAANSAYGDNGAQASGLGNESGFDDQGGAGSARSLSKRVYYFDYDSNVIHDQDKPAITANVNYLMSHPSYKVMLEGHTDPRGSREYNVGLGERRAKAVAAFMVGKGVNPAQVVVISYGAEKLAVPGHTEADYQLDRRVVLVYTKR